MSPSKKAKGSAGSNVLKEKGARRKKKEESTPNLQTFKPATSATTNILRVLAIAAVIGITVYIYSIRERVEDFAAYGYPGIFLIALMANATVFLPAPGVAVVFAMGSIFNPIGVALAAGTGGALGELSGYLAGFSGQAIVERTDIYNKIHPWIEKYGGWTILVLSAIPNPFFDIAGIAAGMAKMKLWRFLLFCWVGQIIKMAMFAYAGAYSIDWIASFYK
ncbi:MAG: VTT domain-containing protein [Chloroflexi bacterium]|nr:VTT domain-containing protein [Chloroflexota bacterium]